MNEEHKEVLLAIFDEDPSYYVREAKERLNNRTGKSYTSGAIIKAIEDLDLTLKTVDIMYNHFSHSF